MVSRVYKQNHTAASVNLRDAGCIEGRDISAADLARNDAIMKEIANSGHSVYIPAGRWEVINDYRWTNRSNISITGEGSSSILATREDVNLAVFLWFLNCEDISVQNVVLEGPNFYSIATTGNIARAIHCTNDCKKIKVFNSTICGWSGHGVDIRGCLSADISHNLMYFNENHDANEVSQVGGYPRSSNNDIQFGTSLTLMSRYIVVSDNILLSNCKSNVLINTTAASCTVSGNVCITCDKDLVEIDTFPGCSKKDAITIPYSLKTWLGDDYETMDVTCIGNVIKHCRWSGIYCNNENNQPGLTGGIKGSIIGNVIHNTCFELGDVASSKSAGISVEQYQDCVISGNVITNTNGVDNQFSHSFPGIQISCRDDTARGRINSAVISDNIINQCSDFGMAVKYQTGNVKITNNSITDVRLWHLYVFPTVDRLDLELSGNTFRQTALGPTKTGDVIYFESDPGHLTLDRHKFDIQTSSGSYKCLRSETTDCTITNNLFSGPGATSQDAIYFTNADSVVRSPKIHVSGNRFSGFQYAIDGPSSGPNQGPILMTDCTFENMGAADVSPNVDGVVLNGTWEGSVCRVTTDGTPGSGTWVKGDKAFMLNPSVGNPSSYTCTTGGTAGGASWTPDGGSGGPGSDNVGMDYVINKGTFPSSQVINWAEGNHQSWFMNSAAGITSFSDPADPQRVYLVITQSGPGNKPSVWPPNLDQEPVVNTEPGSLTFIEMYFDGTGYTLLS